jgi:alpha-glucosidase
MNRLGVILLPAVLLAAACGKTTAVSSPDGKIALSFELEDGRPYYRVDVCDSAFILPSRLGLDAAGIDLSDGFELDDVNFVKGYVETWTQPWGENKTVTDRHNEMTVSMSNPSGVNLLLRFRVFDDGIGFRYEYTVPGDDSVKVMDELTEFNFARDGQSWSIPANFDTYELSYREMPVSSVQDANTPFTFTDGGQSVWASIHEANLTDYPEMTLRQGTAPCHFTAALAPYPDGKLKAVMATSFVTPWRTVQIADEAVGLINSSLILNLNEPSKIADESWIKPMKYIGVWWGMHLGINSWTADSRHGATTANAIRYIDFAEENGIQAVLFEGWNDGWETWGASQQFDFTKPAPDFDLDSVTAYAASKGIQIIMHHETGGNIPLYEAQLDSALDYAATHGMHTLKTGYAGGIAGGYFHHGQYMVRHYRHVVEEAAERHIMVDAHEPIKATGIRRTWPNMMCREGAKGMEWNAWSEGNPPSHEEILPFTRLLGGPMDYTPGIFDILYDRIDGNKDFRQWNMKPATECRVNTTLAKQIADWIILYSPLQMAADLPENYEGHPAFQFFRDYDADIDESVALQGMPGDFIVIARRSGDRWFLGAATDENARTLEQPLDFLSEGVTYKATVYADGDDADWVTKPTSYKIFETDVKRGDRFEMKLAPGGGQAVIFTPAE